MKFERYMIWLLALFGLMNVAIAAGPSNITNALACLYNDMSGVLGVGMLLLIVLAAIIYAIGQTMGAETRARASVWATAMFTGAIVAGLIYLFVPYILHFLAPDIIDASGKLVNAKVCAP